MKKALVIGASSGIGRALSKILAKNGYIVGMMARRLKLLEELQQEIETKTYVQYIDISKPEEATQYVSSIIEKMGGLDLIILNSGTGFLNPELEWEKEYKTINVNVLGSSALASFIFNYFSKQNNGHIVGISSISAIRGNDAAPAYNASKAFLSNYLEGLRKKAYKENKSIQITDIKPGFVDTDMAKGNLFWVASPNKAAEQIFAAIKNKKKEAYITKRWRLISWLLKILPEKLYFKII